MKVLKVQPTIEDGRQVVYTHTNLGKKRHVCRSMGKTAALVEVLGPIAHTVGLYDVLLIVDDDIEEAPWLCATAMGDFCRDQSWGVMCGNRRFTNADDLPSAIRLVWGEYARPVMEWGGIAWGGYMAIKWELVADFVQVWELSVFDDTFASRICKKRGLRFGFHPFISRLEDPSRIGWRDLWEFLVRQHLDVRLYGPWWSVWFVWALLAYATYWTWSHGPWIPLGVYLGLHAGGEKVSSWRVLLGLPLAQAAFLAVVPIVQLTRTFKWKGRRIPVPVGRKWGRLSGT